MIRLRHNSAWIYYLIIAWQFSDFVIDIDGFLMPPSSSSSSSTSITTMNAPFASKAWHNVDNGSHTRRPLTTDAIKNIRRRRRRTSLAASPSNDDHNHPSSSQSRIVFPGGGIFFYWQIGAASHLRSSPSYYDLSSHTSFAGASAGALSATLTATNVDDTDATNLALSLAREAGVWDRPLGLQGVWGGLIERWLGELLPEDAVDLVGDEKLALLVTPVPSFGKNRITTFENKSDLIKCNMASIHLPWFLDGNLTCRFRNAPHIDGSFLSRPEDYFPNDDDDNDNDNNVVTIDWTKDPIMAERKNDFVKLTSPEGIWAMVDRGREFAMIMEDRGEFASLERK